MGVAAEARHVLALDAFIGRHMFSLRILGAGFSICFLSVTASKSGCLAIHVATSSEITEVAKLALLDYKRFCIVSSDIYEFPPKKPVKALHC